MSRHVVDASVEIGNILWEKVQRRELTAAEARLIAGTLGKQPISISPSALVFEAALEIALDTGRTVYDGCYIALAISRGGALL